MSNCLNTRNLPKEYDFCPCGYPITKGSKYHNDDCKERATKPKTRKSKRLYGDNLWTRCK